MRNGGIAGFSAERNRLSGSYRITHLYHCTAVLEMPVPSPRAIAVLDHDVVSIRPEFPVPAPFISILFNSHHGSLSCGHYRCSSFHLEIKGGPFLMRIVTKISLDKPVGGIIFIGQLVNMTAVIFNYPFFEEPCFFSQRVFAHRTDYADQQP